MTLTSDSEFPLSSATGVLFVVAVPIGNLDDITFRAADTLRSADLIACEDTRKSRVLLQRLGVKARVMSLHRFSESRKTGLILDRLGRGQDVAIITDAGTPVVSDPGAGVARSALDASFRVVPIPGPSAVPTALSAAGLDASSFVFHGYAPKKDKDRRHFIHEIAGEQRTSVFFETALRIVSLLRTAADTWGDRRVVLCRELTKLYEEILPGTAHSILRSLEERETIKGEIVVVVEGADKPPPEIDVEAAVRQLMDEGFTGKRLANEAKKRFGIRKGTAYEVYLRLTDKTE
jgi:16S rRNA (cytidine1402-2'-O)-methyltransferase